MQGRCIQRCTFVGMLLLAAVSLSGCKEPIDVAAPEMVSVPAGTFAMGDPWEEGWSSELPVHQVTLSAYEIGTYEVTNAEYAAVMNWAQDQGFVEITWGRERIPGQGVGHWAQDRGFVDGNFAPVIYNGKELIDLDCGHWQISYGSGRLEPKVYDGYSMADHPVVAVSWYGAVAYCNWLSEARGLTPCYDLSTWELVDPDAGGYRLPAEAEWERAAAWDGTRHWRYGTGSDSLTTNQANHAEVNPFGWADWPYTTPVGHYTDQTSPVGCYDMSGNVWEWVQDWHDPEYYSAGVPDSSGPVSGSYRVLRGGGWPDVAYFCRSAFRNYNYPYITYDSMGFRLAR